METIEESKYRNTFNDEIRKKSFNFIEKNGNY